MQTHYITGFEQRAAPALPRWQLVGGWQSHWRHRCPVKGELLLSYAMIRDFHGCAFCGASRPAEYVRRPDRDYRQ